MQFLFSVIDDRTSSGTPQEMAAIRELNLRMRAAGQRVFAGGLAAPETATTIDNREGRAVVTPGATVSGPRPPDAGAGLPSPAQIDGTAADAEVTGTAAGDAEVTGMAGDAEVTGTAYLSGLWIIEVSDEAAALALAREASLVCNRRVEVRAFLA
ncbi:MAG TPA: hypothetical protein PKC73_12745 [Dermatophilaceae bacterium]|nr:hypothetical protein [Actinomycetales bacterium]HMT90493.1 hypothetical protein [Dermatophilaceae bacterium]